MGQELLKFQSPKEISMYFKCSTTVQAGIDVNGNKRLLAEVMLDFLTSEIKNVTLQGIYTYQTLSPFNIRYTITFSKVRIFFSKVPQSYAIFCKCSKLSMCINK